MSFGTRMAGRASPPNREDAVNELDFSGKSVLVVGGSSGIGNGIAQAFRAKGAKVTTVQREIGVIH